MLVPLFPLPLISHLHSKGQGLLNATEPSPPCHKQPFCSCQPHLSPPQGPTAPCLGRRPCREAGWQQVTSQRCLCRGDRLSAGLPCYCSRLFSSGEAAGPAGCCRAGTAWPILNRLHKESAAPARIFSELYLSKRSAGREGGREQEGGSSSWLAPLPAAHLRQRWSRLPAAAARMLHAMPASQSPRARRGPQIPQGQHTQRSRRREGRSIKASVLPLKGSKDLSRGQAMALASIPRAGGSAVHRGLCQAATRTERATGEPG